MRPVRQLHRSGFIEGYRNPHRGLLLRHQRRERRTVAYHHRLAAGGVAAIDGTHRAAGALEAEGVTNAVDSAGVDMLSVNHHRRAAGFQLLIDDAFGARRRQLQVAGKRDPLPLSAIALVICVLTGSVGKYLILGILTVVWPIFARQVSARTPGR